MTVVDIQASERDEVTDLLESTLYSNFRSGICTHPGSYEDNGTPVKALELPSDCM